MDYIFTRGKWNQTDLKLDCDMSNWQSRYILIEIRAYYVQERGNNLDI